MTIFNTGLYMSAAALLSLSALASSAAPAPSPAPSKLTVAPDPAPRGGFEVATGEYKFDASVDPDVLPGVATELWARVFWPKDLTKPRPVVFLLHGNHSTCGSG